MRRPALACCSSWLRQPSASPASHTRTAAAPARRHRSGRSPRGACGRSRGGLITGLDLPQLPDDQPAAQAQRQAKERPTTPAPSATALADDALLNPSVSLVDHAHPGREHGVVPGLGLLGAAGRVRRPLARRSRATWWYRGAAAAQPGAPWTYMAYLTGKFSIVAGKKVTLRGAGGGGGGGGGGKGWAGGRGWAPGYGGQVGNRGAGEERLPLALTGE